MLPMSVEELPLTTGGDGGSGAAASQRHPFFTWTASQIRETTICAVFCCVGWYAPDILFYPTQTQIESRPIPGQFLPSGDFLLDNRYNHPLVNPATVDGQMLKLTGLWLPLLLVIMVEFCRKKANPHRILCTLFTTIGISEGFTKLLKFWVRRPRPNYYSLCGLDIKTQICQNELPSIVRAQVSFPSGHTSLSFCTWTVVALWFFHLLSTKSTTNAPPSKVLLLLSCILPWGWAAFVGVTRIVDYWHHPSDVLAGGLLGLSCATLCFIVHFYPNIMRRDNSIGVVASDDKDMSFHE